MLAVSTVVKLMTVVQTVVGDPQVKLVEMSCLDQLLPAADFHKDAFRAQTNGPKLLARTAETGIASTLRRE